MFKYEKEFRKDNPQTVGETDKHYDLDNYKDWLKTRLTQFEEMKTALEHINKSADPFLTDDELRSFAEMAWRLSNSVLASLSETNEKP